MTSYNEDILVVNDLKKAFTKANGFEFVAVNGISFSLKKGEIFSFLGPNGAGKSTTIGMLTGQKTPTSGIVTIDGMALSDHAATLKAKIGVVTQHNNLDRGLTAKENLVYHALYFGMERNDALARADVLLEKFGLKDWENDYVKSFSGGMVQRLKIARAMVHKPAILFLDEPTTGLDPQYREILWEQMLELNREGTTVFLTTHYMEEPERFSDRIAIFAHGSIKSIGTSAQLKALIPGHSVVRFESTAMSEHDIDALSAEAFVKSSHLEKGIVTIYLNEDSNANHLMVAWLADHKINFKNLSITNATLDDVFIHLTSEKEQSHD